MPKTRSAIDYLLRITRPVPPPFFWIEPTNACNLHCSVCSRDPGGRDVGFMQIPLFEKLVDRIAGVRPMLVTMHLAGEPLLHPNLGSMIQMLSARGIDSTLSTNGTLLDESRIGMLISSGLKSIRVDFSSDKNAYSVTKTGADWDAVRMGIERLLKARRQSGPFPKVFINDLRFEGESPHECDLPELFRDCPAVAAPMPSTAVWMPRLL